MEPHGRPRRVVVVGAIGAGKSSLARRLAGRLEADFVELVTREVLWNNRERLWQHAMVWSDRSLFHWLFTAYWQYRRDRPRLFAEAAHARIVHLRSRGAAETWLAQVAVPIR